MTKPRRIWTGALAASLLAGMLGAGAAYAQCTPLAGEVGRWQAEGDAQDCVGGNHGTLLNGAGFDTGYDGQAFAVDGADDYVAVPDAAALDFTTSFTLAAWVNPFFPANGDVQGVVSKPRPDGTGYRLALGPDGTPNLGLHDGGSNCVLDGPAAIPAGEWTHLAVTWGSGEARVYVNGQLVGSGTCGLTLQDSTEPLQIGREFDAGIEGGRHFGGAIDEVRVFDRALTAVEVAELIDPNDSDADGVPNAIDNCPTTFNPDQADEDEDGIGDACDLNASCPPLDGEVARWQADGNALDCVGAHHGTLVNGTVFGTGHDGQAFAVDGVDDYVEVPDDPALILPDALTLTAWVNPVQPANGDVQSIVSKPRGGANTGYRLALGPDGMPGLGMGNGFFNCVLEGPAAVPAGQWTHLAVTGGPFDMKVYVNGRLVNSGGCFLNLEDNGEPLQIGREFDGEGGRHFGGGIDEVRVFNRALTAGEVSLIYDPNDADGDGFSDPVDNCPAVPNPGQEDIDGDGIGDVCDPDNDNDTVPDTLDNCVLTPNTDQADADSDGRGDVCDNCPANPNPGQEDGDGDGLGDACDTDSDNDGVQDSADNCPFTGPPAQDDFDEDGLGDVCDLQLVRAGDEIPVTTSAAEGSSSDVAVDAAGNFVVVWTQLAFPTARIFAQRYDASGTPLGSEFLVSTFFGGGQVFPRVGMNAAGSFVVVWTSLDQIYPAGASILGRRYDSAGDPLGGEFEISASTQTATSADVAMATDGGFLVAWQGKPAGSADPTALYLRGYGSDGAPLGSAFSVLPGVSSVAVAVGGSFLLLPPSELQAYAVSWTRPLSSSNSQAVALLFETQSGFPFADAEASTPDAPRQDVSAAVSGERIMLSWTDESGGGSRRAQVFQPEGPFSTAPPVSPELQVSTRPAQPTDDGDMTIDGFGRFVTTWTELDGTEPSRDGSGTTVLARAFDYSGNALGDDFVVNSTTEGAQSLPRVAMAPDGRLVATWTGPGSATLLNEVFVQVFAPNATPTARCTDVTVSAGPSCTASASIDNGSFDFNAEDTITLSQNPAGPYALGATGVTLTVTDNHGDARSCTGTVTVVDNTPPAPTCPAPITVNGTTAANGATVSFTVSATDACDSSVSVAATPASGSHFPFGTTNVTATATDDSGNSAQCTFTVTVLSPQSQIGALIDDIEDLIAGGDLASNKAAPLLGKLDSATDKLDAGQTGPACNQISSFINQVNAYVKNGTLTAADGQALISAAQSIQTNLGC